MQIRELTAFHVPIALRKPIRHASHTRDSNDTLIVRCALSDGSVGWGEALPRPYVTGESIASVWRQLRETDFSQLAETEFPDGRTAAGLVDELPLADVAPDEGIAIRECFGNSVRCALELAMLDAAGRSAQLSVSDLIASFPESRPVARSTDTVRYSGVITATSPARQWVSALKMRVFGFCQVKVKVGVPGIADAACLRRIRRVLGKRVDLRLDANEAWYPEDVVARMRPLQEFAPTSLEQPVPHARVAALADVRPLLSTPVMLDESLCCDEDAERAIAGGWCDLFNIRISKCGGLLPSVRLAARAVTAGLGFQLGCQVGETGILSAAGRHFACCIGPARFLEGSYDRFLVRERLTDEDVTFGWSGRAPRLTGVGLGVTVDEQRVRSLARRTCVLIDRR